MQFRWPRAHLNSQIYSIRTCNNINHREQDIAKNSIGIQLYSYRG